MAAVYSKAKVSDVSVRLYLALEVPWLLPRVPLMVTRYLGGLWTTVDLSCSPLPTYFAVNGK